ncbi:IclR family transcriptional regulator [Microbaculum marinisediminis]|uniref:IclR family transcriptional regulator n=1 Tax=Microbaculum marinisediminis TaxID=2931392 RepID=A0AAW5R0Q7_9HYPH|nr:IclR family transcriptional regulator [Microbaculum sp. A6E488]MCT8973772.1 IclR family transcriptional regulator [Microbaculum sp. A6E488]
MNVQATPAQGTQMIDRTVLLMRLVATYCPKGARLTDLSRESELPAPTVRRILKRLADHGLVAQDHTAHRYTLGRFAYELGLSANQATGEAERFRPLIEDIAARTDATIYLSMRSGLDCVCIDRVEAASPEKGTTLPVGARLPLGAGVGGMALLAALPEDEAERIIAANKPVYARFVRTTGSNFREHLEAARCNGYVIRRSPVTPGIVGFGLALPAEASTPATAISCAIPATEFAEPRRSATVALVRDLANGYMMARA